MELLLKVLNSVHLWRGIAIGCLIALFMDKMK